MSRLYISYACDAGQTKSSLQFLGATKNRRKVIGVMKDRIKDDLMQFEGESGRAAVKRFQDYVSQREFQDLNQKLTYGYLMDVEDGQFLSGN